MQGRTHPYPVSSRPPLRRLHSYRGEPKDESIVVGRTDYGGEFASAVARDGLFAVQFHPEKSQASGRRLLDSYRRWIEVS